MIKRFKSKSIVNNLIVPVLILLPVYLYSSENQGGRLIQNFDFKWKFTNNQAEDAYKINFSDTSWQTIDLPHDWSIYGPFDAKWASGTGFLPGGIGWYRKTFTVPTASENKKIFIYFDGIYNNSEVWINGVYLGKRPNGYISFQYDLTPYLNYSDNNVIAVKVDHSKYADSRWYTGSGIYRNVKLITTSKVHVKQWGVYVRTPEVTPQKAKVNVEVNLFNGQDDDADIILENFFTFGSDTIIKTKQSLQLSAKKDSIVSIDFEIEHPILWDVDHPNLYKLLTIIKNGGKILDNVTTRVGFRNIRFDPDEGFFLNGKNLKIKGVCLHHDAGCLGAAVPRRVIERRMDLLKEMGCNAIRTSHNPYSSEFMDLCDEKGFLVMDEIFDEWELSKKKWVEGWNVGQPSLDGSASFFNEWHEKDLTDFILRDRNHPSVIMWSIGNEIDYPNDPYSHPVLNSSKNPQAFAKYDPNRPDANRLGKLAEELVNIIKQYDTTRPVSAGLASAVISNETGYAEALDIVGYNYQEMRYSEDHKKYPERVLFGSETGMSLESWKAVIDNDYIVGQFLWTGIEYMGEAGQFPSRNSTSGTIDLAGNKKAEFYFRQSLWTDEPMVYIGTSEREMPQVASSLWSHKRLNQSWNGEKGQDIFVYAFTNCDEVELFLNNQSLGSKKLINYPSCVMPWKVSFKKGLLKAVAKTDGAALAVYELKTAGPASKLVVKADKLTLKADKQDVSHIEVIITDKDGVRDFETEGTITCAVSGPVRLLGMEDANSRNIEPYKDNTQRTYHGKLLLYIQSLDQPGKATVKVTSPKLEEAKVELKIEQ
jgi:beta-galactosidase